MSERRDRVRLFLQLLGHVRLLSDDHDVCPRGRKARGVLAYLAVAPTRSATRERLADLLWTDRGADQARGSLRQALAEVRRCAPDHPFLDIGRERVDLDRDAVTTDIDAVLDAAVDRSASELARIMGDVRGGFGDGLDGLASGFDEWLATERHQQHERIVACVLEAADDMLSRSPSTEMQAILRGLDHLDPLNEAVTRLGMRVDQGGDDRASLHRRYKRLEVGLARDFGSRPTDETRSLFAALTSLAPSFPDSPAPTTAPASPTASPPTILVSPLAVDGRGEAAELAEICTDDIRVALTRLPDLRVIMLDSADAERLEAVCAGAVAVYLLSGRLRSMSGEVRVNLQLGNVHSRTVVWSEQIRLPAGDLLNAVDQIVERATGAVLPSIDRDLHSVLAERTGENDAGVLYMRARLRIGEARTAEMAEEGCALLERVLELDERHLRALLLLARMYNTDFWQMIAGHDVATFRARARALCERATMVEPSSTELAVMRAWCDLRRREWRLAQAGFERAVQALPYDPDTTNLCAFGFCHLGELDKADSLMQRAFRLNPFPPTDYHADYAVILALQGRVEEAEEHFEVSGEEGLQYAAVRIANAARAKGRTGAAALRARFARGFRAAWRGKRSPGADDLRRWIDDTIPLRVEEHRRLLQQGMSGALD
ncbi:BTAD domain-containing putative transcriptional regulator [uncultured Sphingomonas sp.]|uniref:BTAD domain-containing putative transcriptional regulator n=1 Tax=uncultured Sphingomonas sp. TaxID=158754 RepID=UPI0035CCA831